MCRSIRVLPVAVLLWSAAAFSEESSGLSVVELKDGQELRGKVVSQSKDEVAVELAGGSRMSVPAASVRSVRADRQAEISKSGELWFKDANRTRYFYSPSAMMLHKGEGYFSQKELFFSSISYGVTDYLTVQAGGVLPAWLAYDGFNFIGAVKVGGSLTKLFHVAAGAQTLVIPALDSQGGGAMGFVFGTGTLGNDNAHLTLSVGKPFLLSRDESLQGDFLITASGNLRVSKHVALVTENWFVPIAERLWTVDAVGVRVMGQKMAVDLGAVWVTSSEGFVTSIPVPWLSFVYNFG